MSRFQNDIMRVFITNEIGYLPSSPYRKESGVDFLVLVVFPCYLQPWNYFAGSVECFRLILPYTHSQLSRTCLIGTLAY